MSSSCTGFDMSKQSLSPSKVSEGLCDSQRLAADLGVDGGEVLSLRHDEQAVSTAPGFPDGPDVTLLDGVLVAPAILALVLHDQVPAIVEQAHEVRVELVGRGLEPE